MDNFIIVYLVLGISLLVWTIIDLVKNDLLKGGQKIGYLILLVVLPVIGSLIYFQLKNRNRKRSAYLSR